MGTPIMANKKESDNPIISKVFLITNTTYSAKMKERPGDGDFLAFIRVIKTPFFL